MTHEITLIIPTTGKWWEAAKAVQFFMLNTWGGYSQYEGTGGWRDTDGAAVYEPHLRFVCTTRDEQEHNIILDVRKLVADLHAILPDEECFYANVRPAGRTFFIPKG